MKQNLGGILMMGLGMVFIAMGFIYLPMLTTASASLLAYEYSSYTSISHSTFIGFDALVSITPLLVLIGFLAEGVMAMYMGVRLLKSGGGSGSINIGKMILASLAIIFIAIGIIIMPVSLDGISSVMAHKASISETDSSVTGVGVTTGNVSLNQRLYNDSTSEVVSVSSNITETPVADNYTYPLLYLTGLSANQTRTITTTYYYFDQLADFTGYYQLLRVSPLLILIGFISAAVFTGFIGIRGVGRGLE